MTLCKYEVNLIIQTHVLTKYRFTSGGPGGPGARSDFRNKAGARSAKGKKGLERGAILELAGARSADGKIGDRSLERQGQKGLERGALFTPALPPQLTNFFPFPFCKRCGLETFRGSV